MRPGGDRFDEATAGHGESVAVATALGIRSKIRPRFLESHMNEGWIALIIVCAVLIGALMPLLRKDRPSDKPPPRSETLRDWRNEK